MSVAKRLLQAYFNYVYNPVYDFTTARLNRYRKLQKICIGKLTFNDNDKVLCVGLGTGNEIVYILQMKNNVKIVGVDYSTSALQRAKSKALKLGRDIETKQMDAAHLEFTDGSFDKAICLHVMDFLQDRKQATDEILRVLKNGGEFVLTYPSHKDGVALGVSLLGDGLENAASRKQRITAFMGTLCRLLVGLVYLPILLRPKRKSYTRESLASVISNSTKGDFNIEEYPGYQDLIVHGRK